MSRGVLLRGNADSELCFGLWGHCDGLGRCRCSCSFVIFRGGEEGMERDRKTNEPEELAEE